MQSPSHPVKVTGKVNKKAASKTLKATITVKPVAIAAVEAEKTVAVGETAKDLFTVKPAGKKLAYKTSDATIATVDANGVVTAVKAGEATITASSKYAKEDATVKVTVKNVILQSVKQTKADTIEAVVGGKTADLKVADFNVKNLVTKSDVLVKSVAVDKNDATKVTLTTYTKMNNGADIDVTLDGVTKTFKATDGKVAAIAIDPLTIAFSTETEIKAVAKDANGVELDSFTQSKKPGEYTFDITTNDGYFNGDKLFLNKKGDTATAEVTYHTYKYENNQEVGTVTSGKVTITAVDPAQASAFALRIGDSGKKFDDLKDGSQISLSDSKFAAIQIKDTNGKEISDYASYTVESSNEDILVITEGTLADSKANIALTPVKAGAAAIIVKKGNDTVAALAITVVAAREVKTLTLDKYSVTVSNADTKDTTVKATVKDQFGDDISTKKLEIEGVNDDAKNNMSIVTPATDAKTLKVSGYGKKAGTYTYKISDADKKASSYLTINVQDPKGADGYKVVLNQETIDSTVTTDNADTITGSSIEISLAKTKGGIVNGYTTLDVENVEIKKDGKDAVDKLYVSQGDTNTVKFTPVVETNGALSIADAATYTVKVTYTYEDEKDATKKNTITATTSFKVESKQPAFTFSREKDSVDIEDDTDKVAAVKAAYKFFYDGKEDNVSVVDVDATLLSNGQLVIKKVTLRAKISNDKASQLIEKKLDVNQTIVVK